MDTTIDQQVARDEALVPHAKRLRIGRSNFHLLSDISSKESTLQLVYDVLRQTPFFKDFLVTADVLEIYMQEFWATATFHHHSIRFKIDNKKHIVNLESFREMLHIYPRLPHQPFVEPPFEEEILTFLWFLGYSGAIRRLTDVEHKDTKKSNEMYYPRFTKVIIHHFMLKDSSIPKRNKVNWHYVRDDHMFTTIKLEYYAVATGATPPKPKASVWKTRSSFDTIVTPPTAAAGPRLSTSAKGKQPAKASKDKSLSALSEVAMTEAQQLKLATKRSLQQTYISQASGSGAYEGTGTLPGVPDVPTDESEEEISWNSTDEEGDDDEGKDGDGDDERNNGDDDEQDDADARDDDDEEDKEDDQEEGGNGEENLGREEGHDEEEEEEELYRDVNINLGRGIQTTQEFGDSHVTLTPVNPDGQQSSVSVSSQFVTSMLNLTPDAGIEFIFETTSQMDVQTPTSVAPFLMSAPTVTPSTIATITTTLQAPTPPTTTPSTRLQDLPDFGSPFGFDNRLKTLEANFSEFMQTNQFAGAVSSIPRITIDENMQKIIKEQVKEQVKTSAIESATAEERMQTTFEMEESSHPEFEIDHDWNKTLPATHKSIQLCISKLAKQSDSRSSFDELMDTFVDFSNFLMNRLKVETLTSELLAGPTYELMKGSCKSLMELEFFLEEVYKATTDQLDRVNPKGALSRKYTTSVTKKKATDYEHIKWIEDLFYGFAVNRESARDVYSKRRIIAITELKIVEWHNYKHLDWITVRRDDDKLYKFKEGDFKRIHIQDIEDMLLLLVQGKLTNLTVEERFAFNASLRTPDTCCSDLKRKEAYSAYSDPRGFIYQNKDKQNMLMQIDELHKFSDGTLIDVRTALDDRLKGIRMKYLPQTIWRKSDKDRAAAMI
nr:hypothetical protein [Tanacetum cinerariifolium]